MTQTTFKKCLYCDNMTHDPHFQSRCCGRGMCDYCFDSLQGTEEQFQIDNMEDEDYEKYVEGVYYPFDGDYICFNHAKENEEKHSCYDCDKIVYGNGNVELSDKGTQCFDCRDKSKITSTLKRI